MGGKVYRRFKKELKSIRDETLYAYIKRPGFHMSGNRELVAEGIIDVEKYTADCIVLNASGIALTVCGRGLSMVFYNCNAACVNGVITSIEFCQKTQN